MTWNSMCNATILDTYIQTMTNPPDRMERIVIEFIRSLHEKFNLKRTYGGTNIYQKYNINKLENKNCKYPVRKV